MASTHDRRSPRRAVPYNPDDIPQFGPACLELWTIDPLPIPPPLPRQQKGGR